MIWNISTDLPHEFYVDNPKEVGVIQKVLFLISDEISVEYIGDINGEHLAVMYIIEDLN
jgi:hypothetical protein